MSTTSAHEATFNRVLTGTEILQLQQLVRKVPVAESIVDYAVAISRHTRPNNNDSPQFVKDWVNWGAGPRASQYLILGAKARAVMLGRSHASFGDVKAVARSVLRHRILTNFNAEADGITSLDVIDRLLEIEVDSLT